MIFAITLLVFFGFYSLYGTSKRVELSRSQINLWLHEHPKFSKVTGIVLLLLALIFSAMIYGMGAGIFTALVLLMTIASLVILVFPIFIKRETNAR
ncbi:hypothetical protein ACEZ3G_01500 [Maribacter algicola]|uniref:Uncharacterized protein n=1 Tax=Meishania litoralis TaxID=3434685 RepID=A0ACC7LFE0_9FLAO